MPARTKATVPVMMAVALGLAACAETTPEPRAERYEALEPGMCREWKGQPIERVCVPRTARENAELALEIAETCSPCGTTADTCTVTVEAKEITLSLDGKVCAPARGAACTEACAKRRVVCKIPPLQSGRYLVRRADTSGEVTPLDVTTDATAPRSCSLAEPRSGT